MEPIYQWRTYNMIAEMYEAFPGLYIIEIYLKKSRNDYQQKCKRPKFLLRASFLHAKNISFFIFIQLDLVPRSFLLEKGKSPGDKVVLILATDHELVNLYTVAKTIHFASRIFSVYIRNVSPLPRGIFVNHSVYIQMHSMHILRFQFTRTRVGSECSIVSQLATPVPYFPLVYPHICL